MTTIGYYLIMNKKILLILFIILVACSNKETTITSFVTISSDKKEEETIMESNIILSIDDNKLDVSWEDNNTVKELKEILNNNDIIISTSLYGGFEQVGPLGNTLTSSDEKITTMPGDIVLYNSDQIVIFFDSNTWEYTKLGHVDLDKEELTNLLNKDSVEIKLALGE